MVFTILKRLSHYLYDVSFRQHQKSMGIGNRAERDTADAGIKGEGRLDFSAVMIMMGDGKGNEPSPLDTKGVFNRKLP